MNELFKENENADLLYLVIILLIAAVGLNFLLNRKSRKLEKTEQKFQQESLPKKRSGSDPS